MNISKGFERIGHDVRARRDRARGALLRRLDLQPRQSALRPLLWIVVGGVAGAAIVYFLAPESGRKVRERVVRLAKDRIPARKRPEAQAVAPVTH